ncbi:hypothetical protein ACHAQH_006826 [Verticillium albo-atrum]
MSSSDDLLIEGEPPVIDPYETLGLEREATADQVKSAYRKAALKNHPDKVADDNKSEANEKFQSIAFAYAILSDPARRKRYDTTGSTSESIVDADGFNWSDFYREQFRDSISADAIEKFAAKYKGSDEEKDDVLIAYEEHKGKMDKIYESVMLSDVLEDDERFRSIIDAAIESGDVAPFTAYTKESAKSKAARVKAARAEGQEAEEYAKELGVHDKLFGNKKKGKKGKKDDEMDLAALIQQNQAKRANFLQDLEAKYAAPSKTKKGKKRAVDEEPSEEAFQAAAARLKKAKASESESRHADHAMTSASNDLYPQYCFHLSPTFDQWCILHATAIHALDVHPEFEGQGLFFHRNLPIKWIRLVGVVVAIDDFYNRRIFTLDDSSGACIECNVPVKVIPAVLPTFGDKNPLAYAPRRLEFQHPGCEDIGVGAVVDVKGSVALFRGEKTVKIQKVKILRSTAQEVVLWEKREEFRRDVLGVPWVVGEKQMRRCRREAEGRERKERREAKEQRRRDEEEGRLVTGLERGSGRRLANEHAADNEVHEVEEQPVTGLERRAGRKRADAGAATDEMHNNKEVADGLGGPSRPRHGSLTGTLSQGLESSRSKRRRSSGHAIVDDKKQLTGHAGVEGSDKAYRTEDNYQVSQRTEGLERSRPRMSQRGEEGAKSEQPARILTQGLEKSRQPAPQRSAAAFEEIRGKEYAPDGLARLRNPTEGLEKSRRASQYRPHETDHDRSQNQATELDGFGRPKKTAGSGSKQSWN